MSINTNTTVDNTPSRDKKKMVDGFTRSLEGNQEFPPKTVSIRKIRIDFAVEGEDKIVEIVVNK